MTVEESLCGYTRLFQALDNPDSQCQYLLSLGIGRAGEDRAVPRGSGGRIMGCKTAIWADAWTEGPTLRFQAVSDSLLVNGVLAVFRDLYDGAPAAEAKECPPRFLEAVSREVIYPDIRENGLRECWKRICRAAEERT